MTTIFVVTEECSGAVLGTFCSSFMARGYASSKANFTQSTCIITIGYLNEPDSMALYDRIIPLVKARL